MAVSIAPTVKAQTNGSFERRHKIRNAVPRGGVGKIVPPASPSPPVPLVPFFRFFSPPLPSKINSAADNDNPDAVKNGGQPDAPVSKISAGPAPNPSENPAA